MATAEMASTDEIDALLADADSLMNEVQSGLDETQPTQAEASAAQSVAEPADAPTAESTPEPESDTTEASESTTAESDDAQAYAEPTEASESDAATPVEEKPVASDGAQKAPSEWLQELDEDSASDDRLPDISEDSVRAGGDGHVTDAPVKREPRQKRRGPLGMLLTALHLPIDALALFDLPFAGVSLEAKSYIGWAAIATLLMAGFVWTARDQLRPKRDYPQPPAIVSPDLPDAAQAYPSLFLCGTILCGTGILPV